MICLFNENIITYKVKAMQTIICMASFIIQLRNYFFKYLNIIVAASALVAFAFGANS